MRFSGAFYCNIKNTGAEEKCLRHLYCLKWFKHSFFVAILVAISCLSAFSQKRQVFIKDASTLEPVEYALVKIKNSQQHNTIKLLSDSSGSFTIPGNEKCLVSITAIGYRTFTDSILNITSVIYLDPESINLENVMVTGAAKPYLIDKSIYNIDVVYRRDLDLKAINNLGDALRVQPGFQYRSEGVVGDFLRIQGLTGEHIKILLDGIPVAGRQGGVIDLNQLNLNNLDHIEIVEGPMSVVYGSDAVAGVINLITRTGQGKGFSASYDSYFESVGRYNFLTAFDKRIGKHSLAMYCSRNFNDGWSPDKSSRFKYYKPKLQYGAGLTYMFANEKTKIALFSDFFYEELRDLDSIHLSVVSESDSVYATYLATDGYHFSTRWNSRSQYQYKINNSITFSVQAGYSYYQKRKETYIKNLANKGQEISSNNELNDTSQIHQFFGRIMLNAEPIPKLSLIGGGEFENEQSRSNRTGGHKDISDYAAFLMAIYKPISIVSIQPGIRITENSAFQTTPLVYSANVLLNPLDFQIRISYGKVYRAPSLKELYLEFVDNNHRIFGNVNLKPETGNSVNASIEYTKRFPDVLVKPEVNIFYNSITNSIQLAIDPDSPGRGYYFNIPQSDYVTKGLRAGLSISQKNFNIYSGVSTTGKSALTNSKNFNYSTDYQLSFEYSNHKKSFYVDLNYKYTGKYIDFAGTFDSNNNLNGILEQKFSNYQLADLVLTKRFFTSRLSLSAGVKNIFNVSFVDSQGTLNVHGGTDNLVLAGYGRSYFIKLAFKFQNDEK